MTALRRGFASISAGQVHYAEAGAGRPLLLLHQTPRSWDEYRDVLPLLGRSARAVAMDTIGFGDSSKLPGPGSIEEYARVAVQFLDALEIERAVVVGHHTGGVIAFELGASFPGRVDGLVLSSTPLVDAEFHRERARRPPIDSVTPSDDGSHLAELWRQRRPFYPADRPDLLTRFVLDALKAGPAMTEGHRAVGEYAMERRVGLVRAPTLLVGATDDPFAFPHLRRLEAALPESRVVEIRGGMVPLPDQLPEEVASAVLEFLEAL